ncbi:MAG TPA: energy transducer TonB [Terriglobales bacterium]|nr:energy transducer TonB [Terriglobales bacterium]
MFTQLTAATPKRPGALRCISLVAHLAFLAWLVHSPAPMFIAPSSVTRGNSGTTVTRLYFGGDSGVTQDHPSSIVLPRSAKNEKGRRLAPLAPKRQAGNDTVAALNSNEGPAGSPYGSLSVGSIFGLEVRPALPIVSPDPVIGSDSLEGMVGDEIIEITIDERGNIIATHVLQSLGPQVDQRVLAALAQWQFSPATKNGVPIPSKQDVHYHFPR